MTKEELEKATGQELIDERNYCGVDGYYGDYLDDVNAEMLKRFNRLAELEKRCANYEKTISKMEKGTCDICRETEKDKKIEELEKACEETQELLDKQIEATYKLDKENAELKEELKTAYRKGMRHMAKALKDYDRTDGAWADYFEHTVDKVLQREQLDFEEYGTLADQLTKAKDHIKKLLGCLKQDTNDPQTNYYVVKYMTEAEQFLKDSEVEK